ncbi:hypothetical protein A3B42_02925 [Candidatus Daviesbacteria bacterium RIFCSPLOWO2_01_FULL_38_10]|uniref:Uncharacterized protein n=1 Tax=Candidatus Daviesbacteria bacterium GW2011_GWF2_38_6 TaxID=1618432 RepID=A0A0G0MW28_9BACT|nr:MAG: hypothetical protein US99_C0032G0005 [Candidatus Daviesbacteria bacterium GW2011_GWF2_38_6]OGE27980.1 MAG: hypothetical protein A3D02_04080 [Candidatus Daviesbacteria bacterium RIFCSPHIGHO2_02_FULL_39_41]OGE38657.1 MAG: hypothetical protein A3B42_02925 [Candidatus Daviesbacteria bacterium RIFCSPLOWO2_01_FULL_38_10]OGE68519.1 MAG: hypothetical protein A3H81_02190 [Candidatus Daviesbacteria bacterium RIFCSPLOWO2_02_FULL_38_18]OGE72500.1 MAG: hypothetical protein A3H18_03060 [Candidatus Da
MSNTEGVLGILGVDIGEKYSSRERVVAALQAQGVGIHPTTVSRLRTGGTNGVIIEDRLNCAKVLEEDSARAKNNFFLVLTAFGLAERTRGMQRDKHRFNSAGYTELVSIALGRTPQVVRRCIRAMRSDLVYESLCSPDINLIQIFCGAVDTYLTDFPNIASSLRPRTIIAIDSGWDHQNMVDFYRNLYQHSGKRNIGLWTSYEMKVLHDFYAGRIDTSEHLTHLDREILESHVAGERPDALIGRIKEQTGIPVDSGVIIQHRNLLVYGRPTPRILLLRT